MMTEFEIFCTKQQFAPPGKAISMRLSQVEELWHQGRGCGAVSVFSYKTR
jgi:hypothetical protein